MVTVRSSRVSVPIVDLAHAPGPDGGEDLIRAEAGAALQGHALSVKTAQL